MSKIIFQLQYSIPAKRQKAFDSFFSFECFIKSKILEHFEMELTSDLSFTTESAEQKVLTPSEVMGIVSTAPLNTPEISK